MLDLNSMNKQELTALILDDSDQTKDALISQASAIRDSIFGKEVYARGLIEFTNYCKNNCFYCGIRHDNAACERYRLSKAQILERCKLGFELGYRTFVLQGGEDDIFTDEVLCEIVSKIKSSYPECAITLSVGERSYDSYKQLFDAGADRYLLRHETATDAHYKKLHPHSMALSSRRECLYNLKKIGYQVGAGFMVGSPLQTAENLAEDLLFLKELNPEMVGIGPFIPQHNTPFGKMPSGTVALTIKLLAMLRILLPTSMLPATTAVGTLDPLGREKALKAGANVVMPNLSPTDVRSKYLLYDNKICTGDEAAECRNCIERRINSAGFVLSKSRGDHVNHTKTNT